MRTIAIQSPGDMGHGLGRVLVAAGHRVVAPLAARSDATRARAERAGIEDVGDLAAALSASDLWLSVLPPDAAHAAALAVADAASGVAARPLYVDANAVSPATSARIGEALARGGLPYVDGSLIGAAPAASRPATRLYVSGPGADTLEALSAQTPDGALSVRSLGPEPGRASALKMAYAGLTKGTLTLLTAVLVAAQRQGVFDELAAELRTSQPEAWARSGALPFLPADAERWIGEMHEIAETFRAADLPDGFHTAAAEIFGLLAATPFAKETRETLDRDRTLEDAVRTYAETRLPRKRR